MTQKILKDDVLDKELLQNGFVVVPFLSEVEKEDLLDFFYKHHQQGIPGFYASAHVPDITFRGNMNDKIKEVFSRAIAACFNQCTPLGGSFVVKSNEQKERLHPHQDWNIVDEEKYRSFNIWVPLVDLNDKNGIIRIMPKSHKWQKNFRGPGIADGFQQYHEEIWKSMVPLNMKAGQALIYDHRLFHASEPNTTSQLRVAAVFGIIPDGAQMYYYSGNDGKVEKYESNLDFFMKENIQDGPKILTKIAVLENPKPITSKWQYRWTLIKSVFL